MATNTNYIPSGYPLDSSKIQGAGQGVMATCAAATTTNLDLTLTDDMIITGLQLITVGASIGDYIVVQIFAGGTPVAAPIPGPWYVAANSNDVFDLVIPIKIIAGLTLRVIYHATVIAITPTLAVNYRLWKVLA